MEKREEIERKRENFRSGLGLKKHDVIIVTAYLSGYTGRICLRLNLFSQHIKKKGNINITMYK